MKILMSVLCISILCLSGCESDTDEHVSGIEGTGSKVEVAVAYGTITGFGSIYVNGVHFSTDTATVEIEGQATAEDELAVGMVVEIVGEIDSDGRAGVANAVRAERVLFGTVDNMVDVAVGRKALSVLGQTVYVAEDAEFTGTGFEQLEPGVNLSISGYVAENGYITATYLAQENAGTDTPRVVEGYVTAADLNLGYFELLGLNINADGAQLIAGSWEDVIVGSRVKVTGQYDTLSQALQATQVVLRPQHLHEEGQRKALEGVVREFTSESVFLLRDTAVNLSTAVINNGSASDIQSGARVVVIGQMQNRVLVAERIVVKSHNTNRFKGEVSAINRQAGTFQIQETIFYITSLTQFKDNSRLNERYFNVEYLHIGEDIEVFAVQVNNQWQVTRITRQDFDAQTPNLIRGAVTLIDDSSNFYLDDILVDASDLPEAMWNALIEHENSPLIIDLEGFYTGDLAFKAVGIRINAKNNCDQHIFFHCDEEEPFNRRPLSR